GVTNCGPEVESASHALPKQTVDAEERLLLRAELQPHRLRIGEPVGVLECQGDPHRFYAWVHVADRGAGLPLPVVSAAAVLREPLGVAAASDHIGILPPGRARPSAPRAPSARRKASGSPGAPAC